MGKILEHNLIYDMVGGSETFTTLVDVFYSKIDKDELLRPMFPTDLEPGKKLQSLFLAQKFGGPREYEKIRGHAKLRKRHFKFPIGMRERNQWVSLMLKSLQEIGINEDHNAWLTLKTYFEQIGTKMVNQSDPRTKVIHKDKDEFDAIQL